MRSLLLLTYLVELQVSNTVFILRISASASDFYLVFCGRRRPADENRPLQVTCGSFRPRMGFQKFFRWNTAGANVGWFWRYLSARSSTRTECSRWTTTTVGRCGANIANWKTNSRALSGDIFFASKLREFPARSIGQCKNISRQCLVLLLSNPY